MSYSTHYGPVDPFSPLDNDQGPRGRGAYSQPPPWSPDDMEADLGSPGIEMRNTRPGMQDSRFSGPSLHSSPSEATLFPKPGEVPNESHSFLHDPLNHLDTGIEDRNSPPTHIPYKDNTGRQLRHLLLGSSVRFGITLGLCAAYILTVRLYMKRGIMDENAKKFCNAYTTAISIALGLNIASAFKDMALNMRWPILASRKRNLIELDLLLNCDSLTKLAELALVSRRPLVIFICLGWLFINLLAQAGIAMLSLTYGFEDDTTAVLLTHGNVTIPMMDHFYPWGDNDNPTRQDEEYIAHMYGGLGYNYGMNETQYMPKAGSIYVSDNAMLWYDYPANRMEFIFSDSSSPSSSHGTWSIYTNRTINITYACDVYEVTANGNGTSNNITVKDLGDIFVSHTIPESISFFTNDNNYCDDKNPRCSVVEAFEASETDPWYYKCNITLGQTVNDPHNYSQINDNMAFWATSSIAFVDSTGQEAQIYPQNSLWGEPLHGNSSLMGNTIATFALGAIAGATLFNPSTTYVGMQPSGGFALQQNHPYFFYLILGLICICQLIFVTIVAIFANRVMVGPEGHLSMSMLLRPIADALFGVSGGKENQMFKNAKKYTLVKYEKGRGDRWQLAMTDTSRMT